MNQIYHLGIAPVAYTVYKMTDYQKFVPWFRTNEADKI